MIMEELANLIKYLPPRSSPLLVITLDKESGAHTILPGALLQSVQRNTVLVDVLVSAVERVLRGSPVSEAKGSS